MNSDVELLVTENRSPNLNRITSNTVRVFVDRDYTYGYWIAEDALLSLLTPDQVKQYFSDQSYVGGKFLISVDSAKKIIDKGNTPYSKQTL